MQIKRGTDEFQSRTLHFPEGVPGRQNFLVSEGEYDGKLNSLARAVIAPGFDLPFHGHDDCEEIFIVISGNAVYTDGDKNQHTLNVGDVAICRRGEGHAVANPFHEPLIMIELNLPVEP